MNMQLVKKSKKEYLSYRFEDFIQDDYFISTILYPDDESQGFWDEYVSEDNSNMEDFLSAREYLKSLNNTNSQLSDREIDELWGRISSKTKIPKRKPMYRYWIAVAGVAAACVMFLLKIAVPREGPDVALQQDDILAFVMKNTESLEKSTEIQLVLSDEKTIDIKEDHPAISYGAEGIATISEKTVVETNTSSYNQLIVPHGKRSVLTLSDSSKIWLNAGTRIVYPVVFQNDRREIYVEGEVFLQVAADARRAFFVKTHQADVQALGTQFNVRAYRDENGLTVVLVSGIVHILSQKKEFRLKPNDIYKNNDGKESVENGNIYNYISWKDGLYIYESERLDVIATHLSRYYGVEIKCNEAAASMNCSGKLDLTEKLETVLEGISYAVPIVWSYRDGCVNISPN